MTARLAALWVLVAAFPLVAPAQAPPPQFGPWYAPALRGILLLEPEDVDRLEHQLVANPDDQVARLQVMAYYSRADRAGEPADRARRADHFFWLLAHHPESEILHSPYAAFPPGLLTPRQLDRASALWTAAVKQHPGNKTITWNAASFYQSLDPERYLTYLEATAALDPLHPYAIRPLADFYALSLLEEGPLAERCRKGLDASRNVWVVGNAAYMLQSQYNRSVQVGDPKSRAKELAERYYVRAKALDPSLAREKILPQLPPASAAPPAAVPARPAPPIPRLRPETFPELPPALAATLRARKCTVPQPPLANAAPRNVIRGEFFIHGEPGWAVLCAFPGRRQAVLVFRSDSDVQPDEIARSPFDPSLYSREITTVGRDYILEHYRAYGGPKPPPVDHQGIDDSFLEKASVVWYCYRGKWLQLQGAD